MLVPITKTIWWEKVGTEDFTSVPITSVPITCVHSMMRAIGSDITVKMARVGFTSLTHSKVAMWKVEH